MTNEELILEHLTELVKGQARVEATLAEVKDAHDKRLTDLESDSKWQWRIQMATAPFLVGLDTIAHKLGLWRH